MTPLKFKNWTLVSVTPREMGFAAVGILLAVFMAFALIELIRFIGEPALRVFEPREDMNSLSIPAVSVRGKAEKESRLTVNGRELKIDPEGNFEDEIELQPGVNELVFTAESRFGKVSREVRYVVVR